jgi:hypothetical protein
VKDILVAGSCDVLLENGLGLFPARAVRHALSVREIERSHANMHPWFSQRNRRSLVDLVSFSIGRNTVADVQINDGIIKILNLDVQDPRAAAVLAEYPQVRWAEITRRALKIGLGYLKGGAKD